MFNSFIEKLANTIDGIENPHEMLIRLIIGIALLVVCFVFRTKLAQFIVFTVNKLFIRNSSKTQNALKECLVKPLSFFICVIAIYGATEIIAPSGMVRSQIVVLVKLGLIISVGWFGIILVGSNYSFLIDDNSSQGKKTAVKFISNIFKGAIGTVCALMILEQFGISATKIFAALGLGGVAVAFACKDAVENMLSGFIIIFDKPFEVDDFIEIDGVSGTVTDIKIRTTRIRELDGSERVFPNTTMANSPITNWTKISFRSVNAKFGLTYSMKKEQVNRFITELKAIISNHKSVQESSIRISFDEYGESALIISAFYNINEPNIFKFKEVLTDINLSIKEFVDSSDIEMAFNTQTVHLING
ncbi:MAG: mechanosensitive ion channel family protein [Eubacterium sp.]|nr:mechanosensitive ion channel family protein [Eubacterium sp.]